MSDGEESGSEYESEYEEYEEEVVEEEVVKKAPAPAPAPPAEEEQEDDGLWEKPAWAKGGVKLKKTGMADAMKKEGNLAAPITFTPFKVCGRAPSAKAMICPISSIVTLFGHCNESLHNHLDQRMETWQFNHRSD
jgi:hypothetical protein